MNTSLVELARYVILRENEEYGPFTWQTLCEAMEAGNLVAEDWVRTTDEITCWTSLTDLLYGPQPVERPITRVRRWISQQFTLLHQLGIDSLSIAGRLLDRSSARLARWPGLLALGSILVATAIVLLPDRPLLISVPWIMAGVAAGISMIRRRSFRGVITCLTAMILPFAAFRVAPILKRELDPNRRETALPPIGEMYSVMPRKPADVPKTPDRVRSGIPALGLPQRALSLPQPALVVPQPALPLPQQAIAEE
jgi:hypothetical protein